MGEGSGWGGCDRRIGSFWENKQKSFLGGVGRGGVGLVGGSGWM